MKIAFWICSLSAMCLVHSVAFPESRTEERERIAKSDPHFLLDSLDDQYFSKDQHPLKGLQTFNVSCAMTFKPSEIRKQVECLMPEELKKLGKIVNLEIGDFRYGPLPTSIGIEIGNIEDATGKELPLMRVKLYVSTPVDLLQTKNKDVWLIVWSTNTYVEGTLADVADEKLLAAMRKLIDQFIKNYQFVNPKQKEKPTFYCYFDPCSSSGSVDKPSNVTLKKPSKD